MPKSKLPEEVRKRNKREKARIRQRRCREKKKQALLGKQNKSKNRIMNGNESSMNHNHNHNYNNKPPLNPQSQAQGQITPMPFSLPMQTIGLSVAPPASYNTSPASFQNIPCFGFLPLNGNHQYQRQHETLRPLTPPSETTAFSTTKEKACFPTSSISPPCVSMLHQEEVGIPVQTRSCSINESETQLPKLQTLTQAKKKGRTAPSLTLATPVHKVTPMQAAPHPQFAVNALLSLSSTGEQTKTQQKHKQQELPLPSIPHLDSAVSEQNERKRFFSYVMHSNHSVTQSPFTRTNKSIILSHRERIS